jgi:hypothetical protein
MVWVAGLVGAVLWLWGPFVTLVFLEEYTFMSDLEYPAALWLPLIDDRAMFCKRGGLPMALVIATGLQGLGALLLRRVLAWRFRAQAALNG